jgi:hypothetical protein
LELEVEEKEKQLLTTPGKRKICQFSIRPVYIVCVLLDVRCMGTRERKHKRRE